MPTTDNLVLIVHPCKRWTLDPGPKPGSKIPELSQTL